MEEIAAMDPSFDYDAFYINIFENEQFGSGFVAVNPNSKIPALVDTSFEPPLRVSFVLAGLRQVFFCWSLLCALLIDRCLFVHVASPIVFVRCLSPATS